MLVKKASKNKKTNIPLSKYKPDFDFKKLMINDVGKYSITRPYEAKQIVYYIKESMNKDIINLTITDATSGVGGDTIHFSKYFYSVNAIDILKENTDILLYNCNIFNIGNVNIINDNYLNIYNNIKQDIIYMDPPWGGVGYKHKKIVDIKLDDIPINEVIDNIVNYYKTSVDIFIKLPLNANTINLKIKNQYIIYNKKNKPSFLLIHINNDYSIKNGMHKY